MADQVMNEYRARKLEEEIFGKSTLSKPCELVIKHGRDKTSYWGRPEILATVEKDCLGEKMTLLAILWKCKRSMPVSFAMLLPKGAKLESVMTSCKYMETDRGYSQVVGLVIGGLMMLNVLNYYLFATAASFGIEALASPAFIAPLCGILGAVVAAAIFNKTHFTYRLAVECYDTEKELGMCHFVYAVDCDVPVHKQLSWFGGASEIAREGVAALGHAVDKHYIDLRAQVGQVNSEIDEILKDRTHERVQTANRDIMTRAQPSVWSSPMVVGLVILGVTIIGLVIYFFSGAK